MAKKKSVEDTPLEPPEPPNEFDQAPEVEPVVDDTPIKVRALKTGYYEHIRRREGDVFTLIPRDVTVYNIQGGRPVLDDKGQPVMRHLTPADQFSVLWMELAEADEPETRPRGAQNALTAYTEDLKRQRRR